MSSVPELGIYTDDTIVFSYLSRKYDKSDITGNSSKKKEHKSVVN